MLRGAPGTGGDAHARVDQRRRLRACWRATRRRGARAAPGRLSPWPTEHEAVLTPRVPPREASCRPRGREWPPRWSRSRAARCTAAASCSIPTAAARTGGQGASGARGATLNLDVARALAGFLDAAGAEVRLTRDGDLRALGRRARPDQRGVPRRPLPAHRAPRRAADARLLLLEPRRPRAGREHARAAFARSASGAAARRGRAVPAAADVLPRALRVAGARRRRRPARSACSRPARCAPRPTRSSWRWRASGRRPRTGRATR